MNLNRLLTSLFLAFTGCSCIVLAARLLGWFVTWVNNLPISQQYCVAFVFAVLVVTFFVYMWFESKERGVEV